MVDGKVDSEVGPSLSNTQQSRKALEQNHPTSVLPQHEQGQSKVCQAGQCWQCGEFCHYKKN